MLTLRGVVALLLAVLAGCHAGRLSSDETLTLYPTNARVGAQGMCVIPIRGWICEKRFTIEDLMKWGRLFDIEELVADEQERAILNARLLHFLVDNETGKSVELAAGSIRVRLRESNDRGRIEDTLVVPLDAVTTSRPGDIHAVTWLDLESLPRYGDRKVFRGRAQLLPATGISIVSDIDDTIRRTEVLNTKRMLKNNFLREFEPIPGMADVYRAWAAQGSVAFHYVSASPEQLYEPMQKMMTDYGFPPGSVDLKPVEPDSSGLRYLLDLLDSPPEYKLERIGALVAAFPRRTFVLVGDSGEGDPEIYAELARRSPEQVRLILIRDVTCEDAGAERYATTFRSIPPERWRIYRSAEEIRNAVTQLDAE